MTEKSFSLLDWRPEDFAEVSKQYAAKLATQEAKVRKRFKTYDEAITELAQQELQKEGAEKFGLLFDYKRKRPRGRPRKVRTVSQPTRLPGRPKKLSKTRMEGLIGEVEELKQLMALKEGKTSMTDQEFVGKVVEFSSSTKSLRSDKREAAAAKLYNELKYCRDQTGIRQTKSSRKPKKK